MHPFCPRIAVYVITLVSLVGCSSSPTSPTGAAGSHGADCAVGSALADGSCIEAGVPADQCGVGLTSDGHQGCEPILPPDECPAGSMPVLGKTDCQPVGPAVGTCAEGFVLESGGGCAPILAAEACPNGTIPVIGRTDCTPVGVSPDGCAPGFSFDGDGGCQPMLPAQPCLAGQMAVPGDTQCHEPQSCGSGTWGDIPVDASTQYVDSSYAGGNNDGSATHPWTTLAQALAQASPGATIAVAQGVYTESVVITKGVALWGVCPSKVSVVGTADDTPTLHVMDVPAGQKVEIHGLSATGPGVGVQVSNTMDVTLDGLWVHDTGPESRGIHVVNEGGPASATLRSSLIESTHRQGLLVDGTTVTAERIVVRSTQPKASDLLSGAGVIVSDNLGQRASLLLSTSVIEENHAFGVAVGSSDATLDGVVVRGTLPVAADMTLGIGVLSFSTGSTGSSRAMVHLKRSLLDANHFGGVDVEGADATLDGTVIRGTLAQVSDMTDGAGVRVVASAGSPGAVVMSNSLIDDNRHVGVELQASSLSATGVWVRRTHLDGDMTYGRGIEVQGDQGVRGTVSVQRSLIEENNDIGIAASGSDVTIAASMIRGTKEIVGVPGSGRGVSLVCPVGTPGSTLSMTNTIVEKNTETAVAIQGSDATIDGSVLRDTLADTVAGKGFGRGIAVQAVESQPATLTLSGSLLDQNRYVGLALEGGTATVRSTVIRNTQPSVGGLVGAAINVQNRAGFRASLDLSSSLLESNHEAGVIAFGATVTVAQTWIHDTLPAVADQKGGAGIFVQNDLEERSTLVVSESLLENNVEEGIGVLGSDADVRTSVIRDTQPRPSGDLGRGIAIQNVDDASSTLLLTSVIVERNTNAGVFVGGGEATVTASLIRDTRPHPGDVATGWGIGVQPSNGTATPSTLSLTSSILDHNEEAGLVVLGSTATVTATTIRDTQPRTIDQRQGTGIVGQQALGLRSSLTLVDSLLDKNSTSAIQASGSDFTISGCLLRNTSVQPAKSTFGDGLDALLSTVKMTSSVVENSARASVSSFGSTITLDRVQALCFAYPFDGETRDTDPDGHSIDPEKSSFLPTQSECFTCDGVSTACRIVSKKIDAPEPVPTLGYSDPAASND